MAYAIQSKGLSGVLSLSLLKAVRPGGRGGVPAALRNISGADNKGSGSGEEEWGLSCALQLGQTLTFLSLALTQCRGKGVAHASITHRIFCSLTPTRFDHAQTEMLVAFGGVRAIEREIYTYVYRDRDIDRDRETERGREIEREREREG